MTTINLQNLFSIGTASAGDAAFSGAGHSKAQNLLKSASGEIPVTEARSTEDRRVDFGLLLSGITLPTLPPAMAALPSTDSPAVQPESSSETGQLTAAQLLQQNSSPGLPQQGSVASTAIQNFEVFTEPATPDAASAAQSVAHAADADGVFLAAAVGATSTAALAAPIAAGRTTEQLGAEPDANDSNDQSVVLQTAAFAASLQQEGLHTGRVHATTRGSAQLKQDSGVFQNASFNSVPIAAENGRQNHSNRASAGRVVGQQPADAVGHAVRELHQLLERPVHAQPRFSVRPTIQHGPLQSALTETDADDQTSAVLPRQLSDTVGATEVRSRHVTASHRPQNRSAADRDSSATNAAKDIMDGMNAVDTDPDAGTIGDNAIDDALYQSENTRRPDVSEQLAAESMRHAEVLRNEGRHRFTMRLDPPELGEVIVDMIADGNDMTLRVHAAERATADLLQTAVNEIREQMQTDGGGRFTSVSVDVSTGGNSGGHSNSDTPARTEPDIVFGSEVSGTASTDAMQQTTEQTSQGSINITL